MSRAIAADINADIVYSFRGLLLISPIFLLFAQGYIIDLFMPSVKLLFHLERMYFIYRSLAFRYQFSCLYALQAGLFQKRLS
jgi:hypothetical protein